MQYLQTLNDYMGIPATGFTLNEEMHRFGKKKEYWARGSTWIYKGSTYWKVTYGNWSLDEKKTTTSYEGTKLTPNESRSVTANSEALNIKVEQQKQRKYKEAREIWGPVFKSLTKGEAHEYLVKKKITDNYTAKICDTTLSDLHLYPDTLCVPVYNNKGRVTGIQRIYKDKEGSFSKRYTPGLELVGSICPIAPFKNASTVYLAEGFATACSIHMATNLPTIACFQANNIEASIRTIRSINPDCQIVICADRDLKIDIKTGKPSNVGEAKARDASSKFNSCIVKVVEFPEGSPEHWSDFNDLHCFKDLAQVREQLTISEPINSFTHDISEGFTKEDEETGKPMRQYHRLLDYMIHIHKIKFIAEWKRFVIWKDNYYQFMEEIEIKAFAQSYFNYPLCESEKQRSEFLGLVKSSTIQSESFFDYSKIRNLINLKNGVYNLETNDIKPHSPDYPFQYIIPHNYNNGAKCPVWDQLLSNVTVDRQDLTSVIHEFMGFSISDMEYEKFNQCLILDGKGANGKSTVINGIEMLLGESNYSAIAVSELKSNRFMASSMLNKLANFSEEEDKSVFDKTSVFKKITGGSSMFAEEKGKAGFITKFRAKLIMSYNEMPYTSDASEGMRRRLLILPFKLDLKANPSKKIASIKIKLEREMEGILLHAIEGLKRLQNQGDFTSYPERYKAIEDMVNGSDSVREFYNECILYDGDDKNVVTPTELYEAYKSFMGDNHPRKKKLGLRKDVCALLDEKGLTHRFDSVWGNGVTRRGITGVQMIHCI